MSHAMSSSSFRLCLQHVILLLLMRQGLVLFDLPVPTPNVKGTGGRQCDSCFVLRLGLWGCEVYMREEGRACRHECGRVRERGGRGVRGGERPPPAARMAAIAVVTILVTLTLTLMSPGRPVPRQSDSINGSWNPRGVELGVADERVKVRQDGNGCNANVGCCTHKQKEAESVWGEGVHRGRGLKADEASDLMRLCGVLGPQPRLASRAIG